MGTYKVEWGDTLTSLAKEFGVSINDLVKWNNISDPDLIYVGQNLATSADDAKSSSSNNSNRAVIEHFGWQTGTDRTIFATWKWDKDNTKNYRVMWYYATGDGVAFVGSDSTSEFKQSVYTPPENATKVKFKVKPISNTYTKNNKTTSYWTADWSTEQIYNVSDFPPSTPSGLNVEIKDLTLTATLRNLDVNATHVEFQVLKNNTTIVNDVTASATEIVNGYVSYSCTVAVNSSYTVRCRAKRGDVYSEWTEYSEPIITKPNRPRNILKLYALTETSVAIDWENVATATSYDIEYTTQKRYFDSSNEVQSMSVESKVGHAEVTGLESGQEWFFRVRAVNEDSNASKNYSSWTSIKSIKLGTAPIAPTTWSSTTTAVVGEPLNLYWVHNSEDGSSQTYAELELSVGGTTTVKSIKNSTDEDEKDKTSVYAFSTDGYVEGTKLKWRVRTIGILPGEYYAQERWKTTNENSNGITGGYTTFNFDSATGIYTVSGSRKNSSASVIETLYKVSSDGKTVYRYVSDGNGAITEGVQTSTKKTGWSEWSIQRTVDIYAPPKAKLGISNASGNQIGTLESFPFYLTCTTSPESQTPIGYHVSVTADSAYETVDSVGNVSIMNEGGEVYSNYFDITSDLLMEFSANNINLDNNISYTIHVTASMDSGLTAESSTSLKVSWSDETYWPNAEIAYDPQTYSVSIRPYCNDEHGATIEGITLSLYRREFDGSFTELATGISNTSNTFITDPHPSLDYARYRVVAMSDATGAVSFYDVPGYPIGEVAAIIQWDEDWSNFDVNGEDPIEQPTWTGSLVRLPYNIDVSESNGPDVALVEYIGRKHPVSYYGTQLGTKSSWSMEIEKSDKETLYALRRLAIWMGDVYVREPSGLGYWANISVSFSQTHCELTIPVTIDITRVAGGV